MPPKSKASAKHLSRVSSDVHAVTAGGAVIRNTCVWTDLAPSVKANPEIVYAKCEVLPGTTAVSLKLRQIDPPGFENEEFTAPYSRVHNANDDTIDALKLKDIGMLERQNTAAVLHFLKLRFMKNHIYTTADPLLVAINPFRNVGLCDAPYVIQYRDAPTVQRLPPHVFAIARQAQDNLLGIGKAQTIIVTGESGAGKTEATKHCMLFFASGKSGTDTSIQKAVMAANPVLEAFGNAKTIRNNNSSRFGRFMRLNIGTKGGIQYGRVQGFLLEKVRVVSQQPNERSYHIFYQLLKGATPAEREKFRLGSLKSYRNLNERSGGCYDADNIDDLEEYAEVRQSFRSMQLSASEIDSIFSIVSGVLKLGNVQFEGKNIDGQDNAAEITAENMKTLTEACGLLFLNDVQKVAVGLCSTVKQIGKEEVTVRVQKSDAVALAASLCKAMYNYLFVWIIKRLNETIQPPTESPAFMGMLDIFGFEIFEDNSLEQLLINITNEFLQKNFVDIVFEKESKLYRDEGVSTAELVFTDNREVIECLIGKRASVFAQLEDTCVQKGTDQKFHAGMASQMANQKCFAVPSGGAKTLQFTIVHTIAAITYQAVDFTSKNMDILKAELTEVAQASTNPVVHSMFGGIKIERGKLAKGQLIASQFLAQLDEMMKIIMMTEPHFIRCVKPNESKKPLDWVNEKVLNQLFSLSILEALQLKKLGFSWRRPFRDFVKQYRYLNLAITDEMDKTREGDEAQERAVAVKMIQYITKCCKARNEPFIEGKQWQIGKTMLFLKPETSQAVILMMREAMEEFAPAAALIEALWLRTSLKRQASKGFPAVMRIQSHMRRVLSARGRSLEVMVAPAVAVNGRF